MFKGVRESGKKLNHKLMLIIMTFMGINVGLVLFTPILFYTRFFGLFNVMQVLLSLALIVKVGLLAVKDPTKRRVEHVLVIMAGFANIIFGILEVTLRFAVPRFFDVSFLRIGAVVFVCVNALALALSFYRSENELHRTREAEQKLEADNAALHRVHRLREQIVATISHEARTPLAVLASYTSTIALEKQTDNTDPQLAADLEKIAFEAKRVANLISHLKSMTVNEERAARNVEVDVGSMLQQTADLYRHILERGGVKLVVDIPKALPMVFGNPEELSQVFFNILQNAKKFTGTGSVGIELRVYANDPAGVVRENGELRIRIADTGKGIEPGILPKIFEYGVTGEEGGTGIGLAVCKEILDSHGGDIEIESGELKVENGQAYKNDRIVHGTIVTVTLPICSQENQSST